MSSVCFNEVVEMITKCMDSSSDACLNPCKHMITVAEKMVRRIQNRIKEHSKRMGTSDRENVRQPSS